MYKLLNGPIYKFLIVALLILNIVLTLMKNENTNKDEFAKIESAVEEGFLEQEKVLSKTFIEVAILTLATEKKYDRIQMDTASLRKDFEKIYSLYNKNKKKKGVDKYLDYEK